MTTYRFARSSSSPMSDEPELSDDGIVAVEADTPLEAVAADLANFVSIVDEAYAETADEWGPIDQLTLLVEPYEIEPGVYGASFHMTSPVDRDYVVTYRTIEGTA